MHIAEFIKTHKIQMSAERVNENPNLDGDSTWGRDARHWRVTFTRGKKSLETFFSQGSGHKDPPTAEEVLDCLASDSSSYQSARNFEDWANDLGLDTDSRQAEATYRQVGEGTKRLIAFLGPAAATVLLHETERL